MDEGLFERSRILIGDHGVARLQAAHVLVAGLGGVGGYAAEALARAGIGRLTLVDHDVVSPSNLNRQLLATRATIGQKKVAIMAQRVQAIQPDCHLAAEEVFLTPRNIPDLLTQTRPDWVVDAIDALNCKVGLVVEARQQGLAVISSMGAGGRLSPVGLQVGDLMDSHDCPLARHVRSRVRRRGIDRGVWAVWSPEPALPHQPAEPMSSGRARVVNGTISYLPAIFGLTIAGTVIQQLLQPMPLPQ